MGWGEESGVRRKGKDSSSGGKQEGLRNVKNLEQQLLGSVRGSKEIVKALPGVARLEPYGQHEFGVDTVE